MVAENNTPPQRLENARMWDVLTHMFALNRSAEFIGSFTKTSDKMNQLDPIKQKDELEKIFYEIHTTLYQDTHSGEQFGENRAGNITSAEKRARLREKIHQFADELFDANARAVGMEHSQLANIYARHYIALREEAPFAYGNELTLSTFFTAVSSMPIAAEIQKTSIDFRRLEPADLEAFKPDTKEALNLAAIKAAFLHSLDKSRDKAIPNQRAKADMIERFELGESDKRNPNELGDETQSPRIFKGWDDRSIEIAGVPFLGYQDPSDQKIYLVTITGGLVPYTEKNKAQIEQDLLSGSLIDELPPFEPDKYLVGYNKPAETVGIKDGFEYSNNKAPLVCLDINILTGLRAVAHQQFLNTFEKYKDNGAILTDLEDDNKKDAFLSKVAQEGDTRLVKICETACRHLKWMINRMDRLAEQKIAGKSDVANPYLLLSMGGSGSGKGSAKSLMRDHIEKVQQKDWDIKNTDNFIYASLDDYRNDSDLYKLMQKTGHHADDYSLVAPFANMLRDWVARRAMENNLNLLYDGSAIPFKGRYDNLINNALAPTIQTKEKKRVAKNLYQVDVCAIDAFIDIPEPARADQKVNEKFESVPERILNRLNGAEKRCLPWGVTLNKHTEALKSFMDAVNDKRLKRVFLYNADGKLGTQYLAAAAFSCKQPHVKMREALDSLDVETYKSILKQHDIPEHLFGKIPLFEKENIGYTLRTTAGVERAMIITDMHKMVQMAEKGLQNPFASDLDSLHYRTSKLAGVIPSPALNSIERVIANAANGLSYVVNAAGATLAEIVNYVRPSETYESAVAKQQNDFHLST